MKNIIEEFVAESSRDLDRIQTTYYCLKQHVLENNSYNDIFRTLHNLKGTCGFLGFHRLELLSHSSEDLLESIKHKRINDTSKAFILLEEALGQLRLLIGYIEKNHSEPIGSDQALIQSLKKVSQEKLLSSSKKPLELNQPTTQTKQQARTSTENPQHSRVDRRLEKETAAYLWKFLPQLTQNTARSLGRDVKLILRGEEVCANKATLDILRAPLTHMVRNAISHGIECPEERVEYGKPSTGTITVSACIDHNKFVLDVTDDGRGLDAEELKKKLYKDGFVQQPELEKLSDQEVYQYIFTPGFTTALETTFIYGRGIGMNAVLDSIEKTGGTILINSEKGKGTSFSLKIPAVPLASS